MKPSIAAGGIQRMKESPEHQARLEALRRSIKARHAAELDKAGFLRRLLIHWRMAAEYRAEKHKLEPSPGSV